MMQDYPKLLDKSALVGFTQFDRSCSFSAVKNALSDGVDKQKSGNAPEVAASGEQDMYAYAVSALRAAGAQVEDDKEVDLRGIKVKTSAHVILSPAFGVTTGEIAAKLPGKERIKVSGRSTLLLDGPQIELHGLELDGALVIQAVAGARVVVDKLSVHNKGWSFKTLSPEEDAKVDQKYAIRGYTLQRDEQAFFSFDKPGEYVLSDETSKQFESEYKHPARLPLQ
jgi:UDP-sugar pyrophosphorylase